MIFNLLTLLLVDPGQTPPPSATCVERPALCRTIETYDLHVAGQSVIVDGGAVLSWVDEDGLLLFVGESVIIDVDETKPSVVSAGRAVGVLDDALTATLMRTIKGTGDGLPRAHAGEHLVLEGPSTHIRLSFRQAPGVDDMLLTVENGYEGMLTYDAVMMTIDEGVGRWVTTSVCTVPAGIYTLEHWPHAIVALSLSNFRIGPKGADGEVVCR